MKYIKLFTISFIFSCIGIATLPLFFWFITSFFNTSDEFQIGIITVFCSFLIVFFQHKKTKEREIEARLFKEKSKIYEEIFNLIKEQFRNNRTGKKNNEKLLVNKFEDLNYKILTWGSIETFNAWSSILDIDYENTKDDYLKLLPWAKLYASLRKDLGHNDKNTKPMKFLSLQLDKEGRENLRKKDLI